MGRCPARHRRSKKRRGTPHRAHLDFPPLASHPTWGSFGPAGASATAEWRSAPLRAVIGGWLVLHVLHGTLAALFAVIACAMVAYGLSMAATVKWGRWK